MVPSRRGSTHAHNSRHCRLFRVPAAVIDGIIAIGRGRLQEKLQEPAAQPAFIWSGRSW
jgi:hypothetical protein